MPFRHDKNSEFEAGLPEVSTPDWETPPSEADMMRELHLASCSVLRLATRAHDVAASGDEAAAEAARATLQRQLALTTRMIDDMLFNDSDSQKMH